MYVNSLYWNRINDIFRLYLSEFHQTQPVSPQSVYEDPERGDRKKFLVGHQPRCQARENPSKEGQQHGDKEL